MGCGGLPVLRRVGGKMARVYPAVLFLAMGTVGLRGY